MTTFETDGKEWLAYLAELWQKLDVQIRQTHCNLDKLIEAKIGIEQELSKHWQDPASDPAQLTQEDFRHFREVEREARKNFFRDGLEKVPLRLFGIYQDPGEVAHG
jgi:hypothetical protein